MVDRQGNFVATVYVATIIDFETDAEGTGEF
jgi:hypothetical protein